MKPQINVCFSVLVLQCSSALVSSVEEKKGQWKPKVLIAYWNLINHVFAAGESQTKCLSSGCKGDNQKVRDTHFSFSS